VSLIKTHGFTDTNVKIYENMYEENSEHFFGFKSINGGMSYGRLIDTLVMTVGVSDEHMFVSTIPTKIEIADAMEKWVVMRTEHLTKILITGRYDSVDTRLFDNQQIKTVTDSSAREDLIESLLDLKHTVGLTFVVE